MAVFENNVFKKGRVRLDGNVYRGCTFERTILEYAATGVVELNNCDFIDCQWIFVGAAAHTVDFIRAVATNDASIIPSLFGKTSKPRPT